MKVGYPTLRNYFAAASALGLVAATAPAQAATVVGARSITVKSALPDYLQISELLAIDFGDVNVALASQGGVATALSQYGPEGGPAETNDGAYPTVYDYANDPNVPGLYHSAGSGSSEFVTITFAAAATLKSVAIYGRHNDSTYRDLYDITIRDAGGAVLYAGRLDARAGQGASVTFDAPVSTGVPEPAGWALMILGFGGAGALIRRRPGAERITAA